MKYKEMREKCLPCPQAAKPHTHTHKSPLLVQTHNAYSLNRVQKSGFQFEKLHLLSLPAVKRRKQRGANTCNTVAVMHCKVAQDRGGWGGNVALCFLCCIDTSTVVLGVFAPPVIKISLSVHENRFTSGTAGLSSVLKSLSSTAFASLDGTKLPPRPAFRAGSDGANSPTLRS